MAHANVNNSFYDDYGDRWYTAVDDPIALLRAENKVKTPWVMSRIRPGSNVLDVGCGAGFLSNDLSACGFSVTGVDLSEDSLRVARDHDVTKKVNYEVADAYQLPFADQSFDVVCAMDFLEHVDRPDKVIKECARVLRRGGSFFFYTFNRNPLSWLVVIKLVEWLIPKTPKHMHVIDLFIKPEEMRNYCDRSGMHIQEMIGIKPVISSYPLTKIFTGKVPDSLRFELTRNLMMSYMGVARKS